MKLLPLCPHCNRRIFYQDEPDIMYKTKYSVPFAFHKIFKKTIGYYPLGRYYVHKCEICKRTLAVFSDCIRDFQGKMVVLYRCSLNDVPLDLESCNQRVTCRGCKANRTKKIKKSKNKESSGSTENDI